MTERENLNKLFDRGWCIEEIDNFVGSEKSLILGFKYRGVPYAGRIASNLSVRKLVTNDFKECIVNTIWISTNEKSDKAKEYNLGGITQSMLLETNKVIVVDECLDGYDFFDIPPHYVAARTMLKYANQEVKIDNKKGYVCNLDGFRFVKCSPIEILTTQQIYKWTFERKKENGEPQFNLHMDDLGKVTKHIVKHNKRRVKKFIGNSNYLVFSPPEQIIHGIGICLSLDECKRDSLCEINTNLNIIKRKNLENKKIIVVKSPDIYKYLNEQERGLKIKKNDILIVE